MMEYNSNFELDEAKSILPPSDGELRRILKPKRKLGLKTNLDQELLLGVVGL